MMQNSPDLYSTNASPLQSQQVNDLSLGMNPVQTPSTSSLNRTLSSRMINVALFLGLLGLFLYAGQLAAETVNINKANVAAMQEHLPGIGPVKSQAIVDYRKKNGPFKSISDLSKVPGIGDGTVKRIKSKVSTSKGVTRASDGFKAKTANSSSSSNKKSAKEKSSTAKKTSKDKASKAKSSGKSSSKTKDKTKKGSSKKSSAKKDATKKSKSKDAKGKKSSKKKADSTKKKASKKSSSKSSTKSKTSSSKSK